MKLKPDKNFPGRKFAYVTFGTVAQAQAAVMLINSPNFMPGFKAARRPQVMKYIIADNLSDIFCQNTGHEYQSFFRQTCTIQIELDHLKQL